VNADAVGFLGTREREREREHDEVRPFWLGEGEQRSSPKRENDGGASVLSTDARALRRLEEGGVREIRCQARPRNEKERRRESTAFDRKEKEEMGGGGEVVRCGWFHAEEGGGRGLAADVVWTGDTRGQPAVAGAGRCHGAWEQGNGAARVGCA
jgi:hypothetical protein